MSSGARSAFRRAVRGGALVPALLLLPLPTIATNEWEASAYKGWTVSNCRVEGLSDDLARELRRGLALATPTGLFGRERPVFFPQMLNDDVERCLLFLARRGRPYASVTPRFEGREKQERVAVTLVVDPGPAVRVASLVVEGVPDALSDEAKERITVAPDSVFVDEQLETSVAALRGMLLDAGFARVEMKPIVRWTDSTHVDVRLEIDAGAAYVFRDVVVEGATDDVVPLVRKASGIREGRRYTPSAVEDAATNLRVLGLFRQIAVDVKDVAADSLDVTVDVIPREDRSIDANVRYWSDDRLQVGARWEHRNLFRRGRGGAVSVFTSTFLQKADFSAWWPSVLWARSRGILTVGAENENEDAYDAVSIGGSAFLRYNYSFETTFRFGLGIHDVDVQEKTDDAQPDQRQEGLLTTLTFAAERRATDEPITPFRGTNTRLVVEWAPDGALSDHHYVSTLASFSVYLPLLARTNTALRVTGGLAEPTGTSEDILANKRFYSGGASSMRGFGRRKLGPLDADGSPLGGNVLFEASAELRFPLFWKLRSTAFLDAGQVWATRELVTAANIELAAGLGLWLQTPVGPLRGDLARRITNYEESQPLWVFHFSIGPAF